MYLDEESFAAGGGYGGPLCLSCKREISQGERATRVTFNTDPHGHQGLTGDYHAGCAKPFASLAHVINLDPWGR